MYGLKVGVVLSPFWLLGILDGVVETRVATVQVAHHHDEGIESLLEFLSLFHVFRQLEDQFVAGKAEFVVGQNRGNVRGFNAPFGSGLKMAQNPRQSNMGKNWSKVSKRATISLLTCSTPCRSTLPGCWDIAADWCLAWSLPWHGFQQWQWRPKELGGKVWWTCCVLDRLLWSDFTLDFELYIYQTRIP